MKRCGVSNAGFSRGCHARVNVLDYHVARVSAAALDYHVARVNAAALDYHAARVNAAVLDFQRLLRCACQRRCAEFPALH